MGGPRNDTGEATAEAAMAERLSLALSAGRMGTWRWDVAADQNTRDASLNALFGLPSVETTEPMAKCLQTIYPDDRDRVRQALDGALASGADFAIEYRVLGPDGAVRWVADNGRIVHGTAEPGPVFTGACADITQRKWAEEAVRKSERLFHLVWETSGDGMRLTNEAGDILLVNPAFCKLVGKPKEQLEGRPLSQIYLAERHAHVQTSHRERFLARSAKPHVVTEVVLWNGERRWWEVTNSFLEGEDQPTLLLGVFRDVTGRKRLEEQFHQAQKMEAVGRLAGGIAHDFNNLLQVIAGYCELLDETASTAEAHQQLAAIRRAADRAASLTGQLLAFGRRQLLSPRVLNLNSIVTDLKGLLSRLIGEDIHLTIDLTPGLGPVKADPTQLQQVLMNLAVNARDAMPEGGQLTIATCNVHLDETFAAGQLEVKPGPYVLLEVCDTGSGIPEEVQAHLFEPFFTTKPVGKGTGLGLSTAYGIVKQSGGHIDVESRPGNGATFRVYLPRVAEMPHDDREPVSPPLPRGTETVLLVEDEPAVRDVGRTLLRRCGYTVLEAADGMDALAVAAEHPGPIHLLITDVVMSQLGGRELAERLSRVRQGLKILFMSGYTDDAIVRHGVREAECHFLPKPFSLAALAAKVREALDA